LATKLLNEYKQRIESLELIPSGGGAFELTVGDELVYSKLETGEFPDEATMVNEVGSRV
jgi:selenoprotein W-related protein